MEDTQSVKLYFDLEMWMERPAGFMLDQQLNTDLLINQLIC